MTALILDDEKQSRTLIRQYLQDQFPHIIAEEVSTISEAKKFIQHKAYNIIFLDIHLNGGTSFDLLDEIKENNAQIIFITAHSEFAIKAFKYSAVDYLVKPVDPDEFNTAVQKPYIMQANHHPRPWVTCKRRSSHPPYLAIN